MQAVLLVIHLMIAIALVILVLLQRSEGGALGIGGGGGLMSGRGAANMLTRTTAYLAGAFFVTSLGLAILARNQHQVPTSILDAPPVSQGVKKAPAAAGGKEKPAKTPARPSGPQVPASQ